MENIIEKEKILNEYFNSRKRLYVNKIQELILRIKVKNYLPYINYLKEFGTLRLDFGRQTGNSYFIKYLDNILNIESLFVIFNNNDQLNRTNLKNSNVSTYYDIQHLARDLNIKNRDLNIHKSSILVVDNSSVYSDSMLQDIYSWSAYYMYDLVILT